MLAAASLTRRAVALVPAAAAPLRGTSTVMQLSSAAAVAGPAAVGSALSNGLPLAAAPACSTAMYLHNPHHHHVAAHNLAILESHVSPAGIFVPTAPTAAATLYKLESSIITGTEMVCPDAAESDEGYQMIKRQYSPSVLRRKKTHGFRSRNSTPGGKNVLARRRAKGRRFISV